MITKNYKDYEQKAKIFYQQYAKPLEEKHAGEYLAVSLDGKQTLLGKTLLEVVKKAIPRKPSVD